MLRLHLQKRGRARNASLGAGSPPRSPATLLATLLLCLAPGDPRARAPVAYEAPHGACTLELAVSRHRIHPRSLFGHHLGCDGKLVSLEVSLDDSSVTWAGETRMEDAETLLRDVAETGPVALAGRGANAERGDAQRDPTTVALSTTGGDLVGRSPPQTLSGAVDRCLDRIHIARASMRPLGPGWVVTSRHLKIEAPLPARPLGSSTDPLHARLATSLRTGVPFYLSPADRERLSTSFGSADTWALETAEGVHLVALLSWQPGTPSGTKE